MSIASSAIADTAIAGALPVMAGVNGDCVETIAISDAQTASAVVVATQSEAVLTGGNQSASYSAVGNIAENVSANETISASSSLVAAISEANAASEIQSANSAFAASSAETLVALDSASSQLSSSGEINEGVLVDTIQDGSFAALILADIVEGAAISDTQDALTLVNSDIAETAAVSDAAQVFMDLVIYIPRCPIVTADITTRAQANITTQVKAECC